MSFGNELKVLLTGDSKGLSSEMKKGKDSVNGFASSAKKMAGVLAGAFAAGKIVSFSRSVLESTDALAKQSRRLGITKAELDAVQMSFVHGGQSAGAAAKTIDYFNRSLGELEAGHGQKAFDDLGLSARDFIGLGMVDKLNLVKKSLDGVGKSSRAAAVAGIFGRGAASVYEGLEGLEKADAMIKEINTSLGITDSGNIEDLNDSFADLSKKAELVATVVLTELSPAIEKATLLAGSAAIAFGGWFKRLEDVGKEAAAKDWGFIRTSGKALFEIEAMTDAMGDMDKSLEKVRNSQSMEFRVGDIGDYGNGNNLNNLFGDAPTKASPISDEYTGELSKLADKLNNDVIPAEKKFAEESKKIGDAWKEGLIGNEEMRYGLQQLQEEFDKTNPKIKEAKDAYNELQKAGMSLTESFKSPFEIMNESIEKSKELLDKGVISFQTYVRAVESAKDAFAASNPEIQRAAEYMREYKDEAQSIKGKMADLQALSEKGLLPKATADRGIAELHGQLDEIDKEKSREKMQPWLDALKQYDEQTKANAQQNGGIFGTDMPNIEPYQPKPLSEAGVTSASGLMGVALQGALGGAQSKEDKMLNVQEQMQRWLEQIARNTDARSMAYV